LMQSFQTSIKRVKSTARTLAAFRSDQGRVRFDNQDSWCMFPDGPQDPHGSRGVMFVVADGMGGHLGGSEASTLAVRTICEHYFGAAAPVPSSLREAFRIANASIYSVGVTNRALRGLGTTCTALVIKEGMGFIAHIGDSRAYRVSGGRITQLTEDHSIAADLCRRGVISAADIPNHPSRSVLYRALGIEGEVEIDMPGEIEVKPGDRFLLCTDGLSNAVTDDEMAQIILHHPPERACALLLDLANQRGGLDNCTAGVISITDEG